MKTGDLHVDGTFLFRCKMQNITPEYNYEIFFDSADDCYI